MDQERNGLKAISAVSFKIKKHRAAADVPSDAAAGDDEANA